MSENLPAVLVVGGGHMGSALVRGAIASGLPPVRVAVAEPDPVRRRALADTRVPTFESVTAAAPWLASAGPDGQVLLAIKPQTLPTLAADLAPLALGRVVTTILAGTPGERVRALLGGSTRVVRAMPNLPASIGLGITALCPSAGARPGDEALAERLFAGVGEVVRIPEGLMDAFTALAGSGPAYAFILAGAMADAAARLTFDPTTAARIVRRTLLGAASLLDRSDQSPDALRDAVTSPGGTTAAARRVLDDAGVHDAFVRAILAARDRAGELARS